MAFSERAESGLVIGLFQPSRGRDVPRWRDAGPLGPRNAFAPQALVQLFPLFAGCLARPFNPHFYPCANFEGREHQNAVYRPPFLVSSGFISADRQSLLN